MYNNVIYFNWISLNFLSLSLMKNKLTFCLKEFSNLELNRSISDKVRWLEIMGVFLTGIGKLLFMDVLKWRLPFVVVTILVWTAYVVYRYKKDKQVLKDWGFRWDNFSSVLKMVLPFALVSVVVFFVVGYFRGTLNMTWHILPILISYPIWGTIQQFLIIGLFAGNLNELKSINFNKPFILIITALLFAIVHYPILWLILGTFVLAIFYGWLYLKKKNIYVLGLFHGWLGALFYYTVVGEDPFKDVFLTLFN